MEENIAYGNYEFPNQLWEPSTRTLWRFNSCGSKFETPRPCEYRDSDNSQVQFISNAENVDARLKNGSLVNNDPILECLDGPEECRGKVEYRYTGRGHKAWPRCEKHGNERLAREEKTQLAYPDSDMPPSWFDPSYAGERWDDDY